MAVSCPSLPPKILTPEVTDARLRRLDRHTLRMAADGCHLGACSLYVLLVNIESFSSRRAIQVIAQPSLYKTEPAILSRTFSEKPVCEPVARGGFDYSNDGCVARVGELNAKGIALRLPA